MCKDFRFYIDIQENNGDIKSFSIFGIVENDGNGINKLPMEISSKDILSLEEIEKYIKEYLKKVL